MAVISHKKVLSTLYPPVSYDVNGERFLAQCEVDGKVFDVASQSAVDLLGVIEPSTSGNMLSDWERVCGIESNFALPYGYRVKQVIAKINAIGGLSIPYFKNLAQSLGYDIEISELEPFRAGVNRAGDRLALEDVMFHWVVNIKGNSQELIYFRAGNSCAGERLSEYHDDVIETVFEDLKPAHTYVSFSYGSA